MHTHDCPEYLAAVERWHCVRAVLRERAGVTPVDSFVSGFQAGRRAALRRCAVELRGVIADDALMGGWGRVMVLEDPLRKLAARWRAGGTKAP
jgi:hypothetical protein